MIVKENIKRVDAVRYFYLYHFGGLYVDLDFECIKNIDPILQDKIVLGKMGDGKCNDCIPNAFMYSPRPKEAFWKFCIEELLKKGEDNKRPEETTGPVYLKKCYLKFANKDNITVLDSKYLYPIDWTVKNYKKKWKHCYSKNSLEECKKYFPDAYAITYWTHTWE